MAGAMGLPGGAAEMIKLSSAGGFQHCHLLPTQAVQQSQKQTNPLGISYASRQQNLAVRMPLEAIYLSSPASITGP